MMAFREKRAKMMGEEKVSKVLLKLGIPAIIAMMVNAIYNIVDTMFVGMLGNTSAIGAVSVASMGVTLRVFSIGMFTIFGYSQGFQPVAGFNYGAKKYDRLFEAIKLSLKWTTIFTTTVAIMFMIFAEFIISGFSQDPEVIRIGAKTLRALALFFPLFGFQNTYATLFQTLGKGISAAILSFSRQGIFLIPAILILPKLFGLTGVIFCQPFADFSTIMVTAYLAIKISRGLKEEANKYDNNNVQEKEII